MDKLRLMIVDDHQMFRAGIANLLKQKECFEIVGEASNGLEAVELAIKLSPNVLLMDILLPDMDGMMATEKITTSNPTIKILALTSCEDEEYVVNMIRAGAKGYILKESPIDELVLAIHTLAKGSSYFGKEISNTIFSLLEKSDVDTSLKQKAKRLEITSRELEILQYIAAELTNKEIAAKLYISPRTVETHRRNLIQKLRVKNTAGLVRYYMNNLRREDRRMFAINN